MHALLQKQLCMAEKQVFRESEKGKSEKETQKYMLKLQQALDSKNKEFPLAVLKMAQLEGGIGRLLYNKMDNQLRTNKFSEKLAHLEQILN
eukprot:11759718-Ditylum_brightwellii.AAC.1